MGSQKAEQYWVTNTFTFKGRLDRPKIEMIQTETEGKKKKKKNGEK